ncbi:MAG: transglycosylase SLT domain-containing protein, partial [Myxococcales bacterium]|nr:transglycosylase SLT domain-containing protein [Myxococcales bacterium]
FEQRAYGLAEADFARLAAESKDAAVRQEADLRIGVIRMRLREGYDRALNHLRSARGGPDRAMADEAQYRIGLVLGNLHRYEEASKAMATYLERAPRGPFAESAGYQVGRLLHQAGQFDAAIAAHERFLAKKRRDHGKYVWFLGWSHFRKGDCATARRIWAPSIGSRNLLVGPKALYWTARCQRLEGDMAGAAATLATLAERAPLSYYGVLGAALDGRLPPRPSGWPIALPTAPDTRPFEEALPAAWRAKVRVARLLAWAGYPALARDAVDATAVRKAAPTAQREAFGATLDALLERFGDRWRTLPRADRRAPWNERLATHPEAELREILPPAWIALARAAGVAPGEEGDISPWWLLAHMLQESRYKARARSHAGALGPMQILPRTGRLIAARLGFPAGDFFDERLFDPGVALRHAAWYLDALRHEYRGNLVLAMAAYNGGPRRVGEHLETVPDLPFDVSIEEIGAHESRNYCRKVVDHLVRYVSLYGTDAERAAVLAALQPPAKAPAPRGEIRF